MEASDKNTINQIESKFSEFSFGKKDEIDDKNAAQSDQANMLFESVPVVYNGPVGENDNEDKIPVTDEINIFESQIAEYSTVNSLMESKQQMKNGDNLKVGNDSSVFKGSSGNVSSGSTNQIMSNCTQIISETLRKSGDDDPIYGQESFEPDLITRRQERKTKEKQPIRCIQLRQLPNSKIRSQGSEVILESEGKEIVVIGRANVSDIKIIDQFKVISSRHALISWKPEKEVWQISDENSINGTFLIANNVQVKEGDKFMMGMYLCSILEVKPAIPITIKLEFEFSLSEEPKFIIEGTIEISQPFCIGKKHQKQFDQDQLMENDHCYFEFENRKVKLKNFEGVEYKTAKKVESTKFIDLNNSSVIRLGIFNQYSFSSAIKESVEVGTSKEQQQHLQQQQQLPVEKQEETTVCRNCKKQAEKLFKLEPCNHSQFCINCATEDKCPICKTNIKDFQ